MGLASISTQRTSGAFDGNASGLILGVDRALESGNFVLGAMFNIGRSDMTPPSSPKIERTELLFGPYFTGELMQDLYLDGYLLYGTPEYTVGGTDSDGETWISGLTLTKAIIGDAVNWFPFAAIAIRREEPDSSTEIDSSILTLGTTAHFAARQFSGGLNQSFASFELDIGRYEDNLGTEINYTAPRLGLGTEFAFVNGGNLRLGLNGTRGSDDTDMLSLQVSYRLQF